MTAQMEKLQMKNKETRRTTSDKPNFRVATCYSKSVRLYYSDIVRFEYKPKIPTPSSRDYWLGTELRKDTADSRMEKIIYANPRNSHNPNTRLCTVIIINVLNHGIISHSARAGVNHDVMLFC